MVYGKTFGGFLADKRRDREITVRRMAEEVGLSAGYYCDIEQGRRMPPDKATLEKMLNILNPTEEDRLILYDLAGRGRVTVPPDLPDYIMQNEAVRVALRLAKEKADTDDWLEFIEKLKAKGQSDRKG